MSMLTEIAAYLVAQGVCTEIGTDLVIMELPMEPDLMTAVFQYAGDPPGLTFDGPAEDNPGLQVRTRAAPGDLAAGEARAKAAQTALHGYANATLGSTRYMLIRATGSPMSIGNDEQNRPEWTQNFIVTKEA